MSHMNNEISIYRVVGDSKKEQLIELVKSNDIDTIIMGFCDMQCRLMGKRITGDFILENDISEGTHFCNYLLGTNFEMETNENFEFMNWDKGYDDYFKVLGLISL